MQHQRRFRKGSSLFTVLMAAASLAGLAIIGASSQRHVAGSAIATESAVETAETSESNESVNAPSPVSVAMALGVTPESAAAAGLNSAGINAVFGFCSAHLEEASECMELDGYIEVSEQYLAELRRDVRRYGLTEDRRGRIAETEANLTTLVAERDRIVNELRVDLRSTLVRQAGDANATLLDRYDANRDRRVPRQYRVLDLSDPEWAALASALDKAEINEAAQRSENIDPVDLTREETEVLALATGSADAIAVEARITALLPSTTVAFNLASE